VQKGKGIFRKADCNAHCNVINYRGVGDGTPTGIDGYRLDESTGLGGYICG